MNQKKLKVVQIGVGRFGAKRRKLMRFTGLFDLIAAYDINPDALKQCREEDGAEIVNSYEELINYPEAEAVIISTGAKFHAAQIIAAARKGLHVFVEKPVCSNKEDLDEIIRVQGETGTVIGVGHCDHSQDGATLKIKEMIESGEMGRISAFEQTTCHAGGLQIKPGDWRGDHEQNPGGMLFQCGCHAFHKLIYLFGPIKEIQSVMRYDVNNNTETADAAICLITFENGIIGSLNAYHVSPYRRTLNIYGTGKNVYYRNHSFSRGEEMFEQTELLDNCEQPDVSLSYEEIENGGASGGLVSFYNAIRNGGELYPSLIDGAKAAAVVFAAELSAKSGKPVNLEDVGLNY
tara:strand:+ start:82 stop:1125 length:1044 start_codon:yes stop_codon:yes gene_type:complete